MTQVSLGGLVRSSIVPKGLALKLIIGVYDIDVKTAMKVYNQYALVHNVYGIRYNEFVQMIKGYKVD